MIRRFGGLKIMARLPAPTKRSTAETAKFIEKTTETATLQTETPKHCKIIA
jgi:hypothetical protein